MEHDVLYRVVEQLTRIADALEEQNEINGKVTELNIGTIDLTQQLLGKCNRNIQ